MGRLGRFYVLGEGKYCYEKEVYASGVNREIHYLYGGNGLAGIFVLTAVMDVATGITPLSWYKRRTAHRKIFFGNDCGIRKYT